MIAREVCADKCERLWIVPQSVLWCVMVCMYCMGDASESTNGGSGAGSGGDGCPSRRGSRCEERPAWAFFGTCRVSRTRYGVCVRSRGVFGCNVGKLGSHDSTRGVR